MGCSCKNKVNPKYTEGGEVEEIKNRGFLTKVFNAIMQLLFGIVICGIIAVCIVPFLAYIFFHICIGKKIALKIPDLTKFNKN